MDFVKLESGDLVNLNQITVISNPTNGTPYMQSEKMFFSLSDNEYKTIIRFLHGRILDAEI